jgi:LacI family transcriptional regulator
MSARKGPRRAAGAARSRSDGSGAARGRTPSPADPPATIRDVARASNVSIATVSRVFNDSSLVSETTRRRVSAAATRLRYWPNGIARSLITSRTYTLGAFLPDLHGEFFSEVIHGVDLAARERGFHLLVSRASSGDGELTATLRSLRGRVDGLIIMAPELDADALRRVSGGARVVLVNPKRPVPGLSSISIANLEGARAVVFHLIGLGHRRIATITGPERNTDARQRLEGYRQAMGENGLAAPPELELRGDFSEHSGYEAAGALLALNPRPTAVFVANDYMAVGALGAFHDAGVRVPEDVALAGFDDIPLARYLTPPLTTVHVDMLRLGQRAVERLLDPPGAGRPADSHELLGTTLAVRKSCGWNGDGARSRERPPAA